MSQLQRLRVTHKAVLQAIPKQQRNFGKKYWVALPSLSWPLQQTWVLRQIDWLHQWFWCLRQRKYAASGDAWTSRTPRRVSRTGVNGIPPGRIENCIGVVETSSPDLIVIIGTATPCGLNLSQDVGDIQQSTFPGLVRQSQKLDTVVDGKFSDNHGETSIFSMVLCDKFPDSSSQDIYMRCRMNLTADPVQTQTP